MSLTPSITTTFELVVTGFDAQGVRRRQEFPVQSPAPFSRSNPREAVANKLRAEQSVITRPTSAYVRTVVTTSTYDESVLPLFK